MHIPRYIQTYGMNCRDCLRAGLPSGFPSTAPPPVLVPPVLGTLLCGFQTQKKWKPSNDTPFVVSGKGLAASPNQSASCSAWIGSAHLGFAIVHVFGTV